GQGLRQLQPPVPAAPCEHRHCDCKIRTVEARTPEASHLLRPSATLTQRGRLRHRLAKRRVPRAPAA
ncbi:hypothetical protein VTO73DRAFT_6925, partial [Trametes versicolor]